VSHRPNRYPQEPLAKFRVRRFWGLFWPIFDSFSGGYIRMLILPPEKESKIGSKEPENRQNLIFASGSQGIQTVTIFLTQREKL
jgi:hypothetical protein